MKKLLVLGNGLLGGNIVKHFAKEGYKVFSTYYNNKKDLPGKQFQLDVRDKEKMDSITSEVKPDIGVYTSAYHDVDGCEKNEEKSRAINISGVEKFLDLTKGTFEKLVYVSTDYVFDGDEEIAPYTEKDKPKPQSVYAKHKYEAEEVVLDKSKTIVVRPSVIYGWDPIKDNFVTWALKELRSGNELEIVDDQYNNPTYAPDLAEIILELIKKDASGLFNTTGSECLNRYNFTKKIAQVFGLNSSLINPISTEEFGQLAERPKHCCTETKKLKSTIGRVPLSSTKGLERMKEKEANN